jgi:hypothetical protein
MLLHQPEWNAMVERLKWMRNEVSGQIDTIIGCNM